MYSLNEINKQNNKDKVTRVIQYLKSKTLKKSIAQLIQSTSTQML